MVILTDRNLMFGSTSSRSLNPIPQGLPGVASNMNLPNSGWKTGIALPLLLTACRSGTHPPCLLNASSAARAVRMSACLKDSLTLRRSSSKATTRYSISSPQRRASLSLFLARFQIASNCSIPHCRTWSAFFLASGQFRGVPRALLRGRQLAWKRSRLVLSVSTYKRPMPTKQQASRAPDLLVALNILNNGKEMEGDKCYSGNRVTSFSLEVDRL